MKARQLHLYCFSGTGNARTCANWIADEAEQAGWQLATYHQIGEEQLPLVKPEPGSLIGFLSPTHGFHFPAIMRRFIRTFPKSANCRVFVMNTRAGLRIGRLALPGLSGMVHYSSAAILRLKGYKVVGLYAVDLPSNWLSLHPAVRKDGRKFMFNRIEPKIRKVARRLLSGKRVYRALIDLVQDILIAPVALAYMFIGRYFLAKSFIASPKCNHCDLCRKSCPAHAIKVVDGRMFWSWRCESCMKCINQCPERAIETPHGFIGLIVWLSVLAGAHVLNLLIMHDDFPAQNLLQNGTIRFLFISAVMIPFIFAGYRMMHYLMRFRFFAALFTYTAFTKYKFWGRYRALHPGRKIKNDTKKQE